MFIISGICGYQLDLDISNTLLVSSNKK